MSGIAGEPELLRAAVADVTSAVANTLKTTTVLAAAPAGQRYRVYAAHLAIDLGTATPAAASGLLAQIGPVSGPYLAIEWPASPSDHVFIPNGVPLAGAGAINLRTWSATALALAFVVSVLYVAEQV